MKNLVSSILAIATLFAISAFAAEKVYMPPVGTTNIHADYGVAAQKLMKTYIEDDGRFLLVEGTTADGVNTGNQEGIKNKAVEKGCTKYIIAEFTRLGENVILSFKLYNTSSDAPIWADRLKAANPDDFDPIIQRVARTIGTNEKATTDQDIYNVTENETKLPKRKKVNSYFGIGIGGMVPLSPVVEMDAGLNFFGMYDTQTLLIGIDWNLWGIGDSDNNRLDYMDFGLSVYYPFGRRFVAPYVGGGLSYSIVDFNTEVMYRTQDYYSKETKKEYGTYYDSQSGVGAFVGGGVMLNRASNVVLFAEVKYFINFYKLREAYDEVSEQEWEDYDWNDQSLPHKSSKLFQGFMFNLKLGYGF